MNRRPGPGGPGGGGCGPRGALPAPALEQVIAAVRSAKDGYPIFVLQDGGNWKQNASRLNGEKKHWKKNCAF